MKWVPEGSTQVVMHNGKWPGGGQEGQHRRHLQFLGVHRQQLYGRRQLYVILGATNQ